MRAKSDNIGVLYMIANGKATSAELNILAREFALDQAQADLQGELAVAHSRRH